MTDEVQMDGQSLEQEAGSVQIKRLADSFYIPKGAFIAVLVVVATVIPQAMGLSFARTGATWDGKRISASAYFSHFDYSSFTFFLVGLIPTALFGLSFIIAALWPKIKPMKYIAIALFAVTQFMAGFAYTRMNFTNPTHAAFHAQAYKVNAINVGIVSVLFAGVFLLLIIVISLIFRRKSRLLQKLYSKQSCIVVWLIIIALVILIVQLTPVLAYFNALPPIQT